MPRSITDLFSSDENIWTLALIGLAVVLVFMIGKSIVSSVIRRVKSRTGHD
ncbi:MAG TPA: hypothetical protein VGB82_18795 [Alphaproteobacteria bacterium]